MIQIFPSLLACDFSKLGQEVKRTEAAGADALHIDVMDGDFVPNLTMGPCVVASLRPCTSLPFDVHLMLRHPAAFLEPFAKAGADSLTIHLECGDDPAATLGKIRALGLRCALSIKPNTSPEALRPYLPLCDRVLVMTVEPGFGGQKLLPHTLESVKRVRQMIAECGRPVELQVDGGITAQNAGAAVQAGAEILVAGSSVYKAPDLAAAIAALRTPAFC